MNPNFTKSFIHFFFITILVISGNLSSAQEEEPIEDKTLSPYFFVKCDDPLVDQLPLKSTTAEVQISGVIADVTVKQTYCNLGQNTLEAIYVFPASAKAAVYYMQMHVGDRILKAEIREAEQAREEYEEAKEEGKTTSLLEQKRPNVFQMNVANILPGDTIQVEMRYTELIAPVDQVYEFVYPTVVGPRYAELSTKGDSSWIEVPYTHEGELPTYDFDIDVNINAGVNIQNLESPSHESLDISFSGLDKATCSLPEGETKSGNKDFVLQYLLAGYRLESGMLLYEGEEENFFLAMIQPPKAPTNNDIPPREYVFIMDISGSMNGFPISVSKTLLVDLLSNIRSTDRFNILFFAGGSQVLSPTSLNATQQNIDKAIDLINNKEGGGGTNLLAALEHAISLKGIEDYARTFVIVTDGYVSVEKKAFDLIQNNLSHVNFFAFGIGSSVNRYLIEGIARVGMGEPFIVSDQEKALESAEKFKNYIESPVLTNINIDYSGFNVYDVEPLKVPDVFAERPILTFGKWTGNPQGSVKIEGLSGNHDFSQTLWVNNYTPSEENAALKYLWARHKIQILDDYGNLRSYEEDEALNNEIKDEIVRLGLKYNLLTSYTSFIAVDSLIRNNGGETTTVTQPLPLPSGVSNLAVGNSTGGLYSLNYSSDAYGKVNRESQIITNNSNIKKVYPNPINQKFSVELDIKDHDKEKRITLEIFDNIGHLIKLIEIENVVSNTVDLDVKLEDYYSLQPGIYRMSLIIDGQSISSKNLLILGLNE